MVEKHKQTKSTPKDAAISGNKYRKELKFKRQPHEIVENNNRGNMGGLKEVYEIIKKKCERGSGSTLGNTEVNTRAKTVTKTINSQKSTYQDKKK